MRKFGRHYIPDRRDRKYRIAIKATRRVSRYWGSNGTVLDQGDKPHCVGYAWTHWLLNFPLVQFLNPDGIYTLAQQNDEWEGVDYEGTSVRAGAKVLELLGLIERYEWAWDLDGVVNVLLTRGPVVVGTDWYEGMNYPERGVIRAEGENLGGHAYLITGVDTRNQTAEAMSSYGKSWGKKGKATLPFADLSKLIRANGEACLAVERLARAA